jgi:integrase
MAKGQKVRTTRYGVGKRWEARWRDEAGKQRHRSFERKVDAERHLSTVQTDTLRGTYVDPTEGRITYKAYAEGWRSVQVHRDTTRALVETQLRRHAYPYFGHREIGSIRPSEIQGWVKKISADLAPTTVEVIYRYVSASFKAAVKDRRLAVSPCVDIKLPKIPPREVVPIATEKVSAISRAVPDRYRALVILGAGTGLRQGEAFGLDLRNVDFLRRTLKVEQQLVQMPGAAPYLAPPKTAASYRTIPLGQVVVDALAAHIAAYPIQPVMIQREGSAKPEAAQLVFTDDAGQPLKRTSFGHDVWRPALQRIGGGATFHDLRHYFASLLIHHGANVKVVQARLGHATAAETLETYAHLWPDTEDSTRQAVDLTLADVRQVCATEAQ